MGNWTVSFRYKWMAIVNARTPTPNETLIFVGVTVAHQTPTKHAMPTAAHHEYGRRQNAPILNMTDVSAPSTLSVRVAGFPRQVYYSPGYRVFSRTFLNSTFIGGP